VTIDIEERMHLNTAVSSLMELVNEIYAFSETTGRGGPVQGDRQAGSPDGPETLAAVREALDVLVVMVSPFAPHTAEELWQRLGHDGDLSTAAWPSFDPDVARAEEVVIPVQVNGKVRARITVPAGLADVELEAAALGDATVRAHTAGKTIRKVVVARGALVSVVVS
jgi:leucyl-tRNA synthetase